MRRWPADARCSIPAGAASIRRRFRTTFSSSATRRTTGCVPRTAAVIHHGGSGTSHSAARAGVPSIVAPFAGDQFFWAERLRLAGVAPAAVDGRRPKADAFARALDFAAGASVRNRARALGETMRAENGVAVAVAAIECVVSR